MPGRRMIDGAVSASGYGRVPVTSLTKHRLRPGDECAVSYGVLFPELLLLLRHEWRDSDTAPAASQARSVGSPRRLASACRCTGDHQLGRALHPHPHHKESVNPGEALRNVRRVPPGHGRLNPAVQHRGAHRTARPAPRAKDCPDGDGVHPKPRDRQLKVSKEPGAVHGCRGHRESKRC